MWHIYGVRKEKIAVEESSRCNIASSIETSLTCYCAICRGKKVVSRSTRSRHATEFGVMEHVDVEQQSLDQTSQAQPTQHKVINYKGGPEDVNALCQTLLKTIVWWGGSY